MKLKATSKYDQSNRDSLLIGLNVVPVMPLIKVVNQKTNYTRLLIKKIKYFSLKDELLPTEI